MDHKSRILTLLVAVRLSHVVSPSTVLSSIAIGMTRWENIYDCCLWKSYNLGPMDVKTRA